MCSENKGADQPRSYDGTDLRLCFRIFKMFVFSCRVSFHGRIQRGGEGNRGSGPPWNCQIINFCHVDIFRKTPSGNLDLPPPEKIFWIRACILGSPKDTEQM